MSIVKNPIFIDKEKNTIEFADVRYYQADNGEYYPSATTILDAYPKSFAFYEWLKREGDNADEIRDEAGKTGSIVHQLTEAYDLGAEISLLDEADGRKYRQSEWNMFEKYVEFCERFNPKIIDTETSMVSPKLGYGGTRDRIIELDGKRILLDIKTSNLMHKHFWLQLASYVKLNEELGSEKVDTVAILWLNAKTRTEGKKGQIQGIGWQLIFPDKEIDYYWRLFRATQALWMEENAGYKPRNIVYQLKYKK
jgi:hypothetical protein